LGSVASAIGRVASPHRVLGREDPRTWAAGSPGALRPPCRLASGLSRAVRCVISQAPSTSSKTGGGIGGSNRLPHSATPPAILYLARTNASLRSKQDCRHRFAMTMRLRSAKVVGARPCCVCSAGQDIRPETPQRRPARMTPMFLKDAFKSD